ncbi:MAG: alpha/beta hydrolase [Oscillospiraceae bacterium]|nr:alpha/beta hydrolase [Oscillospiraceae bacterium]
MIHNLQIEINEPVVLLGTGLVYKQMPFWCNGSFRPLTISLLRERSHFPYDPPAKKQPVIVFLCGGSWSVMDPTVWMAEMTYFAKRGYAVAGVQYSVSGQAAFPTQIVEIRQAIRYLRAHAEELRLDADRIAVMGESAGGHLAAITALTGNYPAFDNGEYADQSSAVNCAVIFYGPNALKDRAAVISASGNELNPVEKLLQVKDLQSDPALSQSLDCRTFVTKDAPPFLLLHGTADALVPVEQSDAFYNALTEAEVPAEYLRIEDAQHAGAEFFQEEIKAEILRFIEENMG